MLLWLLLTGFTGAVRFALRDVLLSLRSTQHTQQMRVAIYGAGEAGAQLAAALRLAGITQSSPFWMTIMHFGVVRLTESRFSRLRY